MNPKNVPILDLHLWRLEKNDQNIPQIGGLLVTTPMVESVKKSPTKQQENRGFRCLQKDWEPQSFLDKK